MNYAYPFIASESRASELNQRLYYIKSKDANWSTITKYVEYNYNVNRIFVVPESRLNLSLAFNYRTLDRPWKYPNVTLIAEKANWSWTYEAKQVKNIRNFPL